MRAVGLRIKKIRRRFGIAAPKVVIRSHVPWWWLFFSGVLLLFLSGILIWFFLQQGQAGALRHEVEVLRQEIQVQNEELTLLRSTAGTGQNSVSIERAAQQQLLGRIALLEHENRSLKEDILLFERLIPVVGEEAAVRIEHFRVIRESKTGYRYRLLLAYQPAKQVPEFRGGLQLVVSYVVAGKEKQLLFPERLAGASEYQVEMKHFLRREGVFELPLHGEIKAVEVRILQGDTLKAKRLAHL